MTKPSKPFRGKLAHKKDRRYLVAGLLKTLSPEFLLQHKEDISDSLHKLVLLYEHYGIDQKNPDRDIQLVFAMAQDFVPGFQYRPPSGRPNKWSTVERGLLAADIEYTAGSGGKEQSVTWACRKLSKTEPWRSFLGQRKGRDSKKAAPEEALREVYKHAKNEKFASVCRAHCAKTVNHEGHSAWRALVTSMLEEKVRTINFKKSSSTAEED